MFSLAIVFFELVDAGLESRCVYMYFRKHKPCCALGTWIVEFLLKADSGYPKDTGADICTLATPGNSLRYNTHRSAPPVSALAHSRGRRKRFQSPVDMLEHRDTHGQAQVCNKGHQGSSGASNKRRGFSPAAATHHSQPARAHTDVFGLSRLNPRFLSKNRVEPAHLEVFCSRRIAHQHQHQPSQALFHANISHHKHFFPQSVYVNIKSLTTKCFALSDFTILGRTSWVLALFSESWYTHRCIIRVMTNRCICQDPEKVRDRVTMFVCA